MATLGDLKTRVRIEMDRDDLADELAGVLSQKIADAIEFFSDERFWFNAVITTATATAGQVAMTIPATVRRVQRVTLPGACVDVREKALTELERMQDGVTGQPQYYAYYNDQLRFWPVPNAAYEVEITGLGNIGAPATDADSNVWTNEAYALIVDRVKMTLARDVFRDPEGVQLYGSAAAEGLKRLKRETARRLTTPLRLQDDGLLGRGSDVPAPDGGSSPIPPPPTPCPPAFFFEGTEVSGSMFFD